MSRRRTSIVEIAEAGNSAVDKVSIAPEPVAAGRDAAPAAEKIAAEKIRVLIVEDVAADAERVAQELSQAGLAFVSHSVGSKAAFAAALEDFAPDIVLTADRLPDFDGVTALRMVREKRPDLPVIVVTGTLTDTTAMAVIQAGANDCIRKDRMARLAFAVRRALWEAEGARKRRAADAALRESEEHHRMLVERLNEGVCQVDEEGRLSYVNPRFCEISGYPAERLIGQAMNLFLNETDLAAIAVAAAAEAGAAAPIEIGFRRRNGTVMPALISARPTEDGGHRGLTLVVTDLTVHKRVEEQLRAASLYARSLIEASLDPIAAIDPKGRLTDVNAAAIRMLGKPRERLVGSDVTEYFTDPDQARALLQGVLLSGVAIDLPLSLRNAATGTVAEVTCNASLLRNEKGEIAGILAIARDVTKQKQHQEELARLHAEATANIAELQRREAAMIRINELNDLLQTCNSRDEAYPLIGLAAADLLSETSGGLAVFVGSNARLETVAQWGAAPVMQPEFLLDDCWALRRGRMHEVARPKEGVTCRHFAVPPSGPYLCYPLAVHGESLGLLHIRPDADAPVRDEQRAMVVTLAEMVKLALSNLKLREVLAQQATHDALTGLYNRQYLDETLSREMHRARRRKSPLSAAMLDIDHFKGFNDSYGHDAGDALLREIGTVLRRAIRASDIVCRYGGEEFILVFPDSTIPQILPRLEAVRREVKSRRVSHRGQELPGVSVSIGVAQAPEHGSTPEELIRAADQALYRAKDIGRDRVVAADKAPGEMPLAGLLRRRRARPADAE